jgi:hypothetical protein
VSLEDLYPVRKAPVQKPGHVYYLAVSGFPAREAERVALIGFLERVLSQYCEVCGVPCFRHAGILTAVLEFEVLQTLVVNAMDWRPQPALALMPDRPPPRLPSRQEVGSFGNNVPVHDLLPMVQYISRRSMVMPAYRALFGTGATVLYVTPLEGRKFLDKTKEVFGHRIQDPTFQVWDCLPYFTSQPLVRATSHQFEALHSAIGLYIGESAQDRGVLIAADRCIDEIIADGVHLLHRREPTARY